MFGKAKDFCKKAVETCKKVATKVLAVVGVGTAAVTVSAPAEAAWADSIDMTAITADLVTVGGMVLLVGLTIFGFKKVKGFLGF